MTIRLGVNVDHIATLRQARRSTYPDPVLAALLAEQAGADQITVHLRGDRRHIQERDVQVLKATVQTSLNIELAVTHENVDMALNIRPGMVTFVPERPDELTTEGGLELVRSRLDLRRLIEALHDAGVRVSIFVDADIEQIKAAHRLGADALEINTGLYADAVQDRDRQTELERIDAAARMISRLNMKVAAGHGINLHNASPLARIQAIEEFNIGHSIVARSAMVGMVEATREMKQLLERVRSRT